MRILPLACTSTASNSILPRCVRKPAAALPSRSPQEQIEGTRDNMLGPSVLDAEQYPELVLRAVEISGDWPVLVARVEVQLHGRSHVYDSLMQVEREEDRLQVRGSLVVRQTDFGIEPMTVLGGLLGIQDALGIEYRIVTRRITPE